MSTPHFPPSTIDLLRQRRDACGDPWLGDAAYMAGARLARDIIACGLPPRVTMDWSRGAPIDGGGAARLNPTEAAMAARRRMEEAMRAVGPDFAGVLIDVCGFEKGLETLEREHNWPVRSAKLVVRMALNALARHYGYADVAKGAQSRRGRSWAAPDARPRIMHLQ